MPIGGVPRHPIITRGVLRPSTRIESRRDAGNNRRRLFWRPRGHDVDAEGSLPFNGGRGASIGSEYGEGFEFFGPAHSFSQVDVAALNKSLRTTGAERLRHAMKPDEALGAIFVLEGVLADTQPLGEASWRLLAEENCLPLPEVMGPRMLEAAPVQVITEVLEWSRDIGTARSLSYRLAELYSDLFVRLEEPQPGTVEWLLALEKTKVPCAVVSHMAREDVETVLQKMQLDSFFEAKVTFEDDMETLAQQFLCAAVKLGRPPDHCTVFDHSPKGIAAAHNCTMKAVAVQGYFKGYQLKQADVTCASLDELTVYNLRRLFANRGSEFMDHMKAKSARMQKRENTIASF